MKIIFCTFVLAILVQSTVCAQERNPITIDDYYVDFAVPDITAFSILDINTSNVVRPGNVKEFAAGIQNYISEKGELKPGIAIELAPYRLFAKTKKKVSTWQNNKSLKNLQLSIATAQGDSTNLLVAWGINWTPVDKTDPVDDVNLQNYFARYLSSLDKGDSAPFAKLMARHLTEANTLFGFLNVDHRKKVLEYFGGEHQDRLTRFNGMDSTSYATNLRDSIVAYLTKFQLPLASISIPDLESLVAKNTALTFKKDQSARDNEKRFAEEVKKQKDVFLQENWNRLVVQFKAGAKYNTADGAVNNLSAHYYRIFGGIAGRVPGFTKGKAAKSKFGRHSQVIYQANYTKYQQQISSIAWEFSTGGRLLYGTASKRFSGEFLYSTATLQGEIVERLEYIRYTVGGEIKVSEGLWFELAVGGQKFLQGDESGRLVPEFGIKYAIQKKSRF